MAYVFQCRIQAIYYLFIILLLLATTNVRAEPFTIGGDPRVTPSDFRITTFATGLNFPYAMHELGDGSILVGTGSPGNYFATTGQLIRLVDTDLDGVSDSSSVLYTGFSGGVTEITQSGSLFITTSSQAGSADERISFLRAGASPGDALTLLGAIEFDFPNSHLHTTFAHAIAPNPGDPDSFDLYFNVGSYANIAVNTDTISTSGLLTTSLNPDSIYKVSVNDPGDAVPTITTPVQIATGLRNAAGIEFHPTTGDLYFTDNGIDGLTDASDAHSADEVNTIAKSAIGGTVESFGFPDTYTEYRTGNLIGTTGVLPLAAFQPIPAPDGDESEGPAQIAFAPEGFPDGLDNGLFVGFHGQFSSAGVANEENPLVYLDLDTGEYFHFIGNDEAAIGHPDGLLATADSLYIADLSSIGSLSSLTGTGIIYQIKAVPEPATIAVILPLATIALRRRS